MNTIHHTYGEQEESDEQIDSSQVMLDSRVMSRVTHFKCHQRILIVDDEQFNLTALTFNLQMVLKMMGRNYDILNIIMDKASYG